MNIAPISCKINVNNKNTTFGNFKFQKCPTPTNHLKETVGLLSAALTAPGIVKRSGVESVSVNKNEPVEEQGNVYLGEQVINNDRKETPTDRTNRWTGVGNFFHEESINSRYEISKEDVENIFSSEYGFKLTYNQYDSESQYIYIRTAGNNELICTLMGNLGSNKYEKVFFHPIVHIGRDEISNVEVFIDVINKNLPPDKLNLIYNNPVFCIKKPTKEELEEIHKSAETYTNKCNQKWEREGEREREREREMVMAKLFPNATPVVISHELEKQLNNKPVYGTYFSKGEKTVRGVNMRKYLTVSATDDVQYVGTFGCGPCIGLAIVGKANGKPNKITVAHIDANTNVESTRCSLKNIIENTFNGSDTLEITLNASSGKYDMAKRILSTIPASILGKTKIFSELNGSDNFAVNTKTGEICINIPVRDFDLDRELPYACLMMPGSLFQSEHNM